MATTVVLNNGSEMPSVGLGTFQGGFSKIDSSTVAQYITTAIDIGYRHIDTAFAYDTEVPVGQAANKKIEEGVVKREEVFITSKLWSTYHGKDNVVPCLKKSLAEMGLAYLDLYLVHWPCSLKAGDEKVPKDASGNTIFTDIDYIDTWQGMEECVRLGLTKSIGVSNFNVRQLQRLLENCKVKPVVNQIEINVYFSNEKLANYCLENKIHPVAYSPLGMFSSDKADGHFMSESTIQRIATIHNKSPAQICLKYLTQKGFVVIPKSKTPSRMKENLELFDVTLTDQEMNAISLLNKDQRFLWLPWMQGSKEYPFQL